jgi:hypothetical protein
VVDVLDIADPFDVDLRTSAGRTPELSGDGSALVVGPVAGLRSPGRTTSEASEIARPDDSAAAVHALP